MLRKNNKNKIKLTFFALAMSLSTLTLAGCGEKEEVVVEKTAEDSTVVFRYGDNIVTRGEVYIYINTVKERYEMQYGENVWQLTLPTLYGEEDSMMNLTREEVVEEIVRVKTLYAHADELGISVTEERSAEISESAKNFFNGLTDEDKTSMELTEDLVVQVMMENEIAKSVENKLLEKNPVEISDEEARVTTFYDMYFACYSIDNSGNISKFTEEERAKQYENALQACSTLATASINDNPDAESIEKLADYYNLEHAKEQSLSPEEILDTYGEEIYNLLYSMENSDYSTVVESEYGYHVFQMIALTDRKATNARKDNLTKEAIAKKLDNKINEWRSEIDKEFTYPDSVNMEIYDSITIN